MRRLRARPADEGPGLVRRHRRRGGAWPVDTSAETTAIIAAITVARHVLTSDTDPRDQASNYLDTAPIDAAALAAMLDEEQPCNA